MKKKKKKALETLAQRTDIVIKPADKGGAIVIINQHDYIKEAHRQLSDSSFYKLLENDPTVEFKQTVNEHLSQLVKDGGMDERTAHSLVPLNPVAGRFYLLPKIHKKDNPGRPIVAGIGTVTEYLSRYVYLIISIISPSFPSYIKDTNPFLSDILDFNIPSNSLLVTMDVASLYTNILHADGIRAALNVYSEASFDKLVDNSTLSTLLQLILELHNFEFDGRHYVQISGTSMGTRVGPNYANIFMGVLEEEFLNSKSLKPLYYKCFIDDVFLIWPHGESNLLTFIDAFNSAHPSISFSSDHSPSTINFLDVNVTVSEGKLITKLYRKPTDKQQYLNFQSSHVKHCKTGIPYSQAHRFRRICSEKEDFNSNCQQLRSALLKQKYPVEIIDNAIHRAQKLNRSDLLKSTKTFKNTPQTNLVLTHSTSVPKVSSILKKH